MGNSNGGVSVLVIAFSGCVFLIAVVAAGVFAYFKWFKKDGEDPGKKDPPRQNPNKLQGTCTKDNVSQVTLTPRAQGCTYRGRDQVGVEVSPTGWRCPAGSWDTTADWTDCVKEDVNNKQCTFDGEECARIVWRYYKMVNVVPGTVNGKVPNPRSYTFGKVT